MEHGSGSLSTQDASADLTASLITFEESPAVCGYIGIMV